MVELREVRVVDVAPENGVVRVNREGVDPVEGSEMLEVGFQEVWAKRGPHADGQVPGVFEEIALAHKRQEAEFKVVTLPL